MRNADMAPRGYEDALIAAQARELFHGVQDALALQLGERTPVLSRVTVVFDGEWPSGEEMGGVLSMTPTSSLSDDETIAMLAYGTATMTNRRAIQPDED